MNKKHRRKLSVHDLPSRYFQEDSVVPVVSESEDESLEVIVSQLTFSQPRSHRRVHSYTPQADLEGAMESISSSLARESEVSLQARQEIKQKLLELFSKGISEEETERKKEMRHSLGSNQTNLAPGASMFDNRETVRALLLHMFRNHDAGKVDRFVNRLKHGRYVVMLLRRSFKGVYVKDNSAFLRVYGDKTFPVIYSHMISACFKYSDRQLVRLSNNPDLADAISL